MINPYTFGLPPGTPYPNVSGTSTPPLLGTAQGPTPNSAIPGLEGIGQAISGIQQGIDGAQKSIEGISKGITDALTPPSDPWQQWNAAIKDFTERWTKLFTGDGSAQPSQAPGIGSLSVPELAVATIIGAVGLGVIERWNSGYAFAIAILILGGLFLVGQGGEQVSSQVNKITDALHYPRVIPSGG